MSKFPETINIRIPPELKVAIEEAAAREGLNPTALARSLLYKAFFGNGGKADAEPVNTLVDSKVPYNVEAH